MPLLAIRRHPPDPAAVAALAAARAAETRAEIERARALAELRREQAASDRAAALEAERDARRAKQERAVELAAERAARRAVARDRLGKLRPVLPLLIINGGAVYAQAAYAYHSVAPAEWNVASKLALAVVFAVALESIALYVQWHAHDALLLKSYGTASKLRRASWLIAGVVSAINYAHFAGKGGAPTPAAVAFALLSLLSPWLWGLHTRRAQHVQLLAEDAALIDDCGAEFSAERRRAFPIRSYMARRWSIDHGVRDPRAAWAGYNRERDARRGRRRPAVPVEDLDQNTVTMLRVIRLQASRARQAVAAGWAARHRTTVTQPAITAQSRPSDDRQPTPQPDGQQAVTAPPQKLAGGQPDGRTDDGSPDGQETARKTVTRRSPTAESVRRAAAKLPATATDAQIAKKAHVSEASARRHRPRTTD